MRAALRAGAGSAAGAGAGSAAGAGADAAGGASAGAGGAAGGATCAPQPASSRTMQIAEYRMRTCSNIRTSLSQGRRTPLPNTAPWRAHLRGCRVNLVHGGYNNDHANGRLTIPLGVLIHA